MRPDRTSRAARRTAVAGQGQGLVHAVLRLAQRAAGRQQRVDQVQADAHPVAQRLLGAGRLQRVPQAAGRQLGVAARLFLVGGGPRQAQQDAAVGEREVGRAPATVRPGVGEGLQHADRALEQRAVAAEAPLGLQGLDALQGQLQRLAVGQAGRGARHGVLAVGAAQQVQRSGAVAAPSAVHRGRVQHAREDGPFAQGVRVRDGALGGLLGLPQQVGAALHLPQPQRAVRVLRPQHGVAARRPLVLGGAAQQLHGVDQVLHHALVVEPLDQRAGPHDRLVRRPVAGRPVAGAAPDGRELLGQRHEPPQHARGDLREGLRHERHVAGVGGVAGQGVAGRVRASRAAVAELGQGERGEVGAALAVALLDVLRAVLEDEDGLVAAQRGQQGVLDVGLHLVPGHAVVGVRLAGARDQAAEQHLGQFGRAGSRQHGALDELHDRQAQRGRREVDGEPAGGRGGGGAEASDALDPRARPRGARGGRGRLVGAHPAHGPGDGPRTGPRQQPCPRSERHRLRGQHGDRQPAAAGLRGRPGRGAHAQHGGAAQRLAARQLAVRHRQPGPAPQALREGLEHRGRCLAGQLVQHPVGAAAAPQRARAVAHQEGDPAAGGVTEPVRGVQRGRERVGAAADHRVAFRALVQMADLDVSEGAQLGEHLLEFGEHPVPHAHRRRGVQDELEPGVAAGHGPVDGHHQAARAGAQLGRRGLVQLLAQRRRGAAVALQRA
jgi:hypothetical protein